MKKILVTGGLGFIGSHTVVELQNKGFEVVIIDNLSNTTIDVLGQITEITGTKPDFHQIDLRIKNDVKDFFKNNHVDGIIHFAAYKAVGESMGEPLEYYENNFNSLIYLLQEMRDRKLDNFIFSSSWSEHDIFFTACLSVLGQFQRLLAFHLELPPDCEKNDQCTAFLGAL